MGSAACKRASFAELPSYLRDRDPGEFKPFCRPDPRVALKVHGARLPVDRLGRLRIPSSWVTLGGQSALVLTAPEVKLLKLA
jgi:hypothetical protein